MTRVTLHCVKSLGSSLMGLYPQIHLNVVGEQRGEEQQLSPMNLLGASLESDAFHAQVVKVWVQPYLTLSVFQVVLQKSTPPKIRQCVLY